MQPTDLRPLLQCDHPSSVPEGVSPIPTPEGQSQRVVDTAGVRMNSSGLHSGVLMTGT